MTGSPSILLVTDDPTVVVTTVEALRDARIGDRVQIVEDETSALLFLRRQEPYHFVDEPDLVILDLDMGERQGRRILAELQHDTALDGTPVVVLSHAETAGAPPDVDGAITKPVSAERVKRVLRPLAGRHAAFSGPSPLLAR
jgi:CheY-like chemotaxis protein